MSELLAWMDPGLRREPRKNTLSSIPLRKLPQIGEQIRVGDDARHLVRAAELAARAHPFGEPALPQDAYFRRTHAKAAGAMCCVIQITLHQAAIDLGREA